ncbi:MULTISPECIES: TfuA-like protein [Streptomyces]|uniref:TfuA-like protein n=1 Tax=Streptomyces TaxID=1883 RepID=UPI0023DD3F80|nr:TfuA-like protein [Streptomyces sp. FXJ1.172]WEP00923.1 TfuA-like protein [Streptomyces sp. FXJ1.172]
MTKKYCFVGPSLPDAAELTAGTRVELLPPVAAGDLGRLEVGAGDVVAIIDGYSHQRRSVRHKEILDLLGREVRVLGASGMGALRAGELDRFGMQGIGRIYADFRDGRLEADDEVTLLHSPEDEGYRPHSEPLVCMRATFAAAVRSGVCDALTADRLISVFSQRPFGWRSYSALEEAGAEAGLEATTVRALQRYCVTYRQDPKREDALALLDHLRADDPGEPDVQPPPLRVHRTVFLYAWQLAARAACGARNSPRTSALSLLRARQLFAYDYPLHHRNMTLRTLASRCAEECGERAGGDTEAERALRHGEHGGLYRLPADRERLGFLNPWLTPAETGLPPAEQLTIALVRSCRTILRLPWDEIAMSLMENEPVGDVALQFVQHAWEVNDRVRENRPGLRLDAVPRTKVTELLASYWGAPMGELELAALDRGFASTDNAVAAARPFYLSARYNEAAARSLATSLTARQFRRHPEDAG